MRKLLCIFILLFYSVTFATSPEKPRIVVLTDSENEPDDTQSLVRLLVYSNHFDIEGLIATTFIWMHCSQKEIAPWKIREVVEACGKVHENLLLHEPGFPD